MRAARSTLGLVAAAVGFVCPASANGQTIPSPYAFIEERQEVGLFSGYLGAGTGRFGFGPRGGTLLGARYGLELSGPLSLDAAAGFARGTRDVVSPNRPEGDGAIAEADVLLTSIDLHLRLSATGARTWHGLSPFLIFGGGLVWDAADRSAADGALNEDAVFDLGVKFIGNAGPGVRWFITPRIAVRADATFAIWQLETPPAFADPQFGFGPVADKEWVSSVSLTAALLYRW